MNTSQKEPPAVPPGRVRREILAYGVDLLVRCGCAPEHGAGRRHEQESIHDAWLASLASVDPALVWPKEKDSATLANQIEQWQRPVQLTARSPFKFCFRLSEFESMVKRRRETLWRVEYLLQLKQDPSLLVPVADLWEKKSIALKQFDKQGNALEFVLTALGQASGLCPEVSESLRNMHPSGYDLETPGAVRFLRERADALRRAGFSVILPSWWVGKGTEKRIALRAHAKSPALKGNKPPGMNTLITFDVKASLGGAVIDLDELRALARLKVPLIKIHGQWTLLDEGQLATAIRMLEQKRPSSMTTRDLLALSLGADVAGAGLALDGVDSEGWLQQLLDALKGRREIELVRQPKKFTGTLRPYQERGYAWLAFMRQWGLGGCLADDMGLGKTVQTLALLQHDREAGEKRPVLLICPTTVVNNWKKEAEKFTAQLPVHVHHGQDRERKDAFLKIAAKSAMVISSYGLLHRDLETLQRIPWAGVILDEAQNIKNPETKQFKAARALEADYRLALTGTPVENHVGDLWSIMDFLNPGMLGGKTQFKQHFYLPIQVYQDADASAKLKSITGPFVLRRLKTDKAIISDLPDKVEVKSFCTLTREQATLYEAALQNMEDELGEAEGMKRRGMVLATLIKLKQICNHPAHFLGDSSALEARSGKLARLKEMLLEIRALNERTLIFTQFAEMGELLRTYIQDQFGEEVLFLHGGVARKRRDEMVERFQKDDHAPHTFVLSLKAGGTGLNLTQANHVIHYDRWWNPAVENQATDRAFRIGQKRNVQVYKFIVAGTLEERIDAMIEHKTGIAAQVVGAGEQWLTELSDKDLRSLLALGSDALGD